MVRLKVGLISREEEASLSGFRINKLGHTLIKTI